MDDHIFWVLVVARMPSVHSATGSHPGSRYARATLNANKPAWGQTTPSVYIPNKLLGWLSREGLITTSRARYERFDEYIDLNISTS